MDHRDRAAPVALARDAPVAQAEVDPALGDRTAVAGLALEPPRDLLLGLGDRQPVEEARIDHPAVAVIGRVGDHEARRVDPRRAHHGGVAEAVLVDEFEVALVVRGAAEDRAGAVLHEDEVRDVDGQLPGRVERVPGPDAGVEAELLGLLDRLLRGADAPALGDERGELRIFRGRGLRERVIGRERHEARAEQRVGPRRVDLEIRLAARRGARIEREAHHEALRAPDPVALHDADLLGPSVERIETVVQVLGVVGDLEEPLGELALLDERARAPAAAVDHLLVGEHRLIDRIPVHPGGPARHEPGLKEVEEQALLVPVVGRVAGRDLAAPVDREAHRLQLPAHRGDVRVGPFLRVDLVLHRGVLGRHPEGVPAHRVEHVEAAGAHVARHDVAHRVVAHVAHVDAPRRVGEHLEHVISRARVVVVGPVQVALRPDRLPFRLGFLGVVALGPHRFSIIRFKQASGLEPPGGGGTEALTGVGPLPGPAEGVVPTKRNSLRRKLL